MIHRPLPARRWLPLLALLLLAASLAAANLGAMPVSLSLLWHTPIHDPLWQIWLQIRLPRVVLAVLVGAALAGAILLLLADTAARTLVAPAEMPVGLLTSLLGGPWFLWLIIKQRRANHV